MVRIPGWERHLTSEIMARDNDSELLALAICVAVMRKVAASVAAVNAVFSSGRLTNLGSALPVSLDRVAALNVELYRRIALASGEAGALQQADRFLSELTSQPVAAKQERRTG